MQNSSAIKNNAHKLCRIKPDGSTTLQIQETDPAWLESLHQLLPYQFKHPLVVQQGTADSRVFVLFRCRVVAVTACFWKPVFHCCVCCHALLHCLYTMLIYSWLCLSCCTRLMLCMKSASPILLFHHNNRCFLECFLPAHSGRFRPERH